jgi:hypothetical protein
MACCRLLTQRWGAAARKIHSVNYFRNQPVGGFGLSAPMKSQNLVKVATDLRVKVIGWKS